MRFEEARYLAVFVELEAPVLEVVVHPDAEDAPRPDRAPHRVHRLVEERHPFLEGRPAVSILPAVRLRVQEVGDEVVHADGKLDPVEVPRHHAAPRGRELFEGLLDLGDRHRVGNELGGGEVGRRHRRRRDRGPPEERRRVRDPTPPMSELGKERHLVGVGRGRHPLVHRHDALVVARERERHLAVVVRHGVPRHHDPGPALRPLSDVVHVALRGEAVSGLEVRGVPRVHDPVLERVPPDGDGAEEMRKRIGHDGSPSTTFRLAGSCERRARVSSLSSTRRPSSTEPRAARARNRVSASCWATAIVDSSSISLFMLTPRCRASAFNRSCVSSGGRTVRVAIPQSSAISARGQDQRSRDMPLARTRSRILCAMITSAAPATTNSTTWRRASRTGLGPISKTLA